MTALEFIIEEISREDWWYLPKSMKLEIIKQAKEMEKQQIIDAFVDGRNVGSKDHPGVDGNYYYEQVYK